ncbi:hypothetical protein HPT25_05825 [Bacillus sp. BRMEA1]|uniref:hypothetical protein n=1 Tax=Neobacillus endophyticus TaxID=2738405 RepID=UPI001563A62E|nr:hypothetical protein [Neobacillus endophyticus]NRD77013.1 hypothetical protein [Neobacillus endophyticus]
MMMNENTWSQNINITQQPAEPPKPTEPPKPEPKPAPVSVPVTLTIPTNLSPSPPPECQEIKLTKAFAIVAAIFFIIGASFYFMAALVQ